MYFCNFPGTLSQDSINQMDQIANNVYSNHHPFWHTMLIKLWGDLGLHVFKTINAAVALYSIFQIVTMAICFSFALITIYQIGVPDWISILTLVWYAAMPYNIMYSFTMWKDVLFGGVTLMFIVSIYRVLNGMGS